MDTRPMLPFLGSCRKDSDRAKVISTNNALLSMWGP